MSVDELAAVLSDPRRPSGDDARGPLVLVDFDHTLFASNSTELFLAAAWPSWLVSIILGLVRGALPWHRYDKRWGRLRDYLSISAVISMMPWTLPTWRLRAPQLFVQFTQHRLVSELRAIPPERIVIVSFGYAPIIRALLRRSPWEACRLISMPVPCPPALLTCHKTDLLRRFAPEIDFQSAIFISDSEDDADLLKAAFTGCLIPQQGDRLLADAKHYLPWRYASLGKYGRAWTVELILHVDFVLMLLATTNFQKPSVLSVLGAILFFVSLHAIYEIGYFENDFEAAKREAAPSVSPGASLFDGFPLERHAWCWAAVLGTAASTSLALMGRFTWSGFLRCEATWAIVLGVTRLCFYVYNRQPVSRRLFIYPLLQACKTLGVLAVLPASVIGVGLLTAQIVAMWMNYTVYRLSGLRSQVNLDAVRLIVFLIFASGLLAAQPHQLITPGPVAIGAIALWLVWRVVRRYFRSYFRNFHAKPGSNIWSRIIRSV
jgi:hypothetical protein